MNGKAASPAPLGDILGHAFARPELLADALAHPSAAKGGGRAYERLEFLGDRVLGLIVADLLMRGYPDADEGALSMRFHALVRRETLVEVAREIDLGAHLVLSKGEMQTGGQANPAILADACEAVIGALYFDGGLDSARAFVERYWSARLEATAEPPRDAKTRLQEWAQGRGLPLPDYAVTATEGPAHAPVFTVEARVEGLAPTQATGASKRAAEQAAAALALDMLALDTRAGESDD